MSAGPRRLGKYELLQRLGRGGMAEVWKAFDPQLRRFVAIKFLRTNLQADPDFMVRFVREAQAIASLRHPNIVQVHDFQVAASETGDPMPYMVMDYIEGSTLKEFISQTARNGKFLDPDELVRLFTPICMAVDYAHQHHMIHRDIKPANILLDQHNTARNAMGEPILTDFGIVKLIGTATGSFTSASAGTPLYISPEQAQGHPGNTSTDIYALGVILYEICTGTTPFKADDGLYAVLLKHMYDTPTRPALINPDLPAALEFVILRCLSKDPNARFPRATSLVAALAESLKLPVPEEVKRPAYPRDPLDQPTYYDPLRPDAWPAAEEEEEQKQTPPADQQQEVAPKADDTAPSILTLLKKATPLPAQPEEAASPAVPTPAQSTNGKAAATGTSYSTQFYLSGTPYKPVPAASSAPAAVPAPPAAPARKDKRRKVLLLALSSLVILALLAASLLTVLSQRTTTATAPQFAGQASFLSSDQGRNDELQISLHGVPNPGSGKSDDGWLLPNAANSKAPAIFLGPLQVSQGNASLLYQNPQHTNLLDTAGSILVTEESANTQPHAPTTNKAARLYSANLPQTAGSNGLSVQTYLRDLLSTEPNLQQLNLQGGVDVPFLQNTAEVWKWSKEGVDHTKLNDRRGKVVNILYYLRGQCAQQDLSSAAPNTWTQADLKDIAANKVPLLACSQSPLPGNLGYIDYTRHLVDGLAQAPGVSKNQQALAAHISSDLVNERAKLQAVLQDAQQLVKLDDAHFQSSPLMNDMELRAGEAYGGWFDPATGIAHPGASTLYGQIQALATFDIRPNP